MRNVSSLSITLVRDDAREQRDVETTTTGLDLFGTDRSVVAVRVGGELRDLDRPFAEGDVVEPVLIDGPDGLAIGKFRGFHIASSAFWNGKDAPGFGYKKFGSGEGHW